MTTIAKRLESVTEYYFSQKLREIEQLNKAGKHIINLGIGSPDLPPHPAVIRSLQEHAARPEVHGYQGYKGVPALRLAFADWYRKWYTVHLDPETEVLPLMGSKEGIMHICMTYLEAGDEALIPDPGYPTYASAVTLAGARPVTYRLEAALDWQPDLEALSAQDLSRVKLMFVNYPHMPTGQQAPEGLFTALVAFARKHDILLVHDNPYSFILNDRPVSLLSVPGAIDVALELNSLSKSHNMAGWRVGVLCGAAAHIAAVLRFKSNMDSGMFLPLQLAAVTALGLDEDWHRELNTIYAARREKVYQIMALLDCRYAPDQVGLFVWGRIPDRYQDAYALSDEVLYRCGVFITPGGIFGSQGDRYIRISLCGDIARFEEAITRISK